MAGNDDRRHFDHCRWLIRSGEAMANQFNKLLHIYNTILVTAPTTNHEPIESQSTMFHTAVDCLWEVATDVLNKCYKAIGILL